MGVAENDAVVHIGVAVAIVFVFCPCLSRFSMAQRAFLTILRNDFWVDCDGVDGVNDCSCWDCKGTVNILAEECVCRVVVVSFGLSGVVAAVVPLQLQLVVPSIILIVGDGSRFISNAKGCTTVQYSTTTIQ